MQTIADIVKDCTSYSEEQSWFELKNGITKLTVNLPF